MSHLSFNNKLVFAYLPKNIQQQLLFNRDSNGNVQVNQIETERLLAQSVIMELEKLKRNNQYTGTFTPIFHSYGQEGRSCMPSNFEASYCYALGQTAGKNVSCHIVLDFFLLFFLLYVISTFFVSRYAFFSTLISFPYPFNLIFFSCFFPLLFALFPPFASFFPLAF